MEFETLYANLFYHLQSNNKLIEFSLKYMQIIGPRDKFIYLWKSVDVQNYTKLYDCYANKDDIKAEVLRKEGNDYFKKLDFLRALECYNKSIIFSSHPAYEGGTDKKYSTTLSLGYANRSAVLFELENYEACLKDVIRAINCGYPSLLKFKLILRQAKCHMALKNENKAIEILNAYIVEVHNMEAKDVAILEGSLKDIEVLLSEIVSKKQTFIKNKDSKHLKMQKTVCSVEILDIPELQERNSSIPAISSALTLRYSDEKGRSLFANRDIVPGEVLIKEKNFGAVLLSKAFVSHCSYCLLRTFTPVPCPNCSCVLFCSDECLTKARQQYHDVECPIMPTLVSLDMGENSKLVHKIVVRLTFEVLKKKIPLYEKNKEKKSKIEMGFNDQNMYMSDDFLPIYHLITNLENRDVSGLFKRGLMAVYLVKLLLKSKYFGDTSIISENEMLENIYLVGTVTFTLLMSMQCNSFSISEECISYTNYHESEVEQIGSGVFSSFSLASHSCNPNVFHTFYGSTVVVRAIQFIPKGTEITTGYGSSYVMLDVDSRRNELKKQYGFLCNCEACLGNWPQYFYLSETIYLKCPKCKLKIESPKNECPHCITDFSKTSYDGKSLKQILIDLQQASNTIHKLFINEFPYRSRQILIDLQQANNAIHKLFINEISYRRPREVIEKNEQYFTNVIYLLSLYSVLPNRAFFEAQDILKFFYDRKASHYYL